MIKVTEINRYREVRAEFLDKGLVVSLPSVEPGVYTDRKWLITAMYTDTHPGVEQGWIWLDLLDSATGRSYPVPSNMRLYVH